MLVVNRDVTMTTW